MSTLAQETIEDLNRWSGRAQGVSTERRLAARHDCRRKVYLELPEGSHELVEANDQGMVEAESQNISSNGIGFATAQMLPTDRITFCFPQADGAWLKIAGQIVRLRQLTSGCWEYGAKFIGRVDAMSK